jgi:ligand-binding SRPBCC domain-containing protein
MAHFEYSSVLNADKKQVFDFITQMGIQKEFLPSDYKLELASPTDKNLKKGEEVEFRASRFGISVLWRIFVDEMTPATLMRYRQIKGPFLSWIHTQKIEEHSQGVLLKDIVEYDVAFGLLGKLAQDLFIKSEMRRFFEIRHRKIQDSLLLVKNNEA